MAEKIVWNILLIDDDEDDYLLTREMLAMAQGNEIQLKWSSSFEGGRKLLESVNYDAVLIDYDLGEHTGLELIQEATDRCYTAPLILITGRGGYEVDLEAMQAGATLFLTKSEVNPLLLHRSIRYAIERKQADLALKDARQSLENKVEARTQELAQANKDLQIVKLSLEERVKERTEALRKANENLASQLTIGEQVFAELKAEKKISEDERDLLRAKEDQISRISRLYLILSKVNEAIVRIHQPETLYTEVCRAVAESGFPLVWFGEVRGRTVVPVAASGPKVDYLKGIKIETQGELGTGPTGQCIRENRTIICEDISTSPETQPWWSQAAQFGIRASASSPLHRNGETIGAFCLYADEPDIFTEEQISLLEQLSADISFALDSMDQEKRRQKAENELRESESAYRSLFEGMTEGFAVHEIICDDQGIPIDWRFLEMNPAFERLTGLRREEVVGKLHSVILPGDDPLWLEVYGNVALTGKPIHFENYSPALKQHYEVFAYQPAPCQFAVLFMNITEKKLLDISLRESEQRYRTLFESVQEGFYMGEVIFNKQGVGIDFTYLDANPAFEKLMGLHREDIIGHRAKELVPLIKPGWAEVFGKVQQTGEPTYYSTYSDAFSQYFEAYVFRPAEGQFAVLVTDISERKQAEEKLEQQNLLVELSYEPIFSWDLEGGIQTWNAGCEQLYGYSRQEALGKISHDLLQTRHPVPVEEVIAELKNTCSWSGELRHTTKDGREVILESRQQLMEMNGKSIILETNREITDRKHGEQILLRKEVELSEAQRIAKVGSWYWNAKTDCTTGSEELLRIYGFDPATQSIPNFKDQKGILYPPETWELLNNAVQKTMETGIGYELEVEAFRKGEPIWVMTRGEAIRDATGQISDLHGTVQDITEQKHAELSQKQRQDQINWLARFPEENPNPVLRCGFDGRILYSNPPATKLPGWNCIEGEVVNLSLLNLLKQAISRGCEMVEDQEIGGRYYSISVIPLRAEGYANFYGRDISRRKIVEDALRENETWFRTTLASIGDAVITTDKKGLITYLNPIAEKLSGWSSAEASGKPMEQVFPLVNEQTCLPTANPIGKVLESGFTIGLANHTALIARDRQIIPIEDSAAPIKGLSSETIGVVMVFHDVREKRLKEAALHEAEMLMQSYALKLERSNHELQDFTAMVSHDLQEPLRKIKSFGDLLETHLVGKLDDQDKEYLHRMLGSATRMQQLIQSLLAYARVTTKTQPFHLVDLQEIAAEVIASFDSQVNPVEAGIDVQVLPEIEADAMQMRQLFQNLISNSLKFCNPAVPPQVKITAQVVPNPDDPENKSVKIQVQDNGVGFDMKFVDRIFQPFERLHGRSEFEGTGMGLAICKRIVERHQGSITAQSQIGLGATFTIILPLNQKP